MHFFHKSEVVESRNRSLKLQSTDGLSWSTKFEKVKGSNIVKCVLRASFFSTFVWLMPVNLNQYRGTVGVFNNRNIAICNLCNIWYSQSFRNCSTFIFFNAIFICSAYLFTLQECLKSSFLSSLRVKCRTIHTSLNLILYISILALYANHFWLDEIVLKLSGDIEENPRPKPNSNQSFSISHWNLWAVSLPITI